MTVRGMYSNPPNHGARTISTILCDDELKKEWSVFKFNIQLFIFNVKLNFC